MKTMLRLNKIKSRPKFEGTTVCVKVNVEEHENNRNNEGENTERLDEFFADLENNFGSANWPQFKFTFKAKTRELAQKFGENLVESMDDLDIWRGVKLAALSDADKDNNYTATLNSRMG